MMVHYHLPDAEFDADSKNHLLRTLRWHLRRLRQRKYTKCQNDKNEISQVWHDFSYVNILPRSDLYGTSWTMPLVLSPQRFSDPSEVKTPRTAAPKWSTRFHFFGQNSKFVEKYCNIDQKKGNFLLIPNIIGWALYATTYEGSTAVLVSKIVVLAETAPAGSPGLHGLEFSARGREGFLAQAKVYTKFQHDISKIAAGGGG